MCGIFITSDDGSSEIDCIYFLVSTIEFNEKELSSAKCDKIGTGGFGDVYRGQLRGTTIAIKYLNQVINNYQSMQLCELTFYY